MKLSEAVAVEDGVASCAEGAGAVQSERCTCTGPCGCCWRRPPSTLPPASKVQAGSLRLCQTVGASRRGAMGRQRVASLSGYAEEPPASTHAWFISGFGWQPGN